MSALGEDVCRASFEVVVGFLVVVVVVVVGLGFSGA